MGSDLIAVDIDRVKGCGGSLRSIAQALRETSQLIHDCSDAVGHAHLASTLHSFTANWSVHRDRILNDLDHCAQRAIEAAEAYRNVDRLGQ